MSSRSRALREVRAVARGVTRPAPLTLTSGIDELRLLVANASRCSESFNERWTVNELVAIHQAMQRSDWDIHAWTPRQLREALKGLRPEWDDKERPVYGYPSPLAAKGRR